MEFIRAVRKRGSFDIEPIAEEVIRKEKYFAERYPDAVRAYTNFLEEKM